MFLSFLNHQKHASNFFRFKTHSFLTLTPPPPRNQRQPPPPFISPGSTKRPARISRIVSSPFYKPRGQEKQIEPISSVEITLKTTSANVEMYYLHPPNPIYFMHISPSKLNTACSLLGNHFEKDSPYLISVLSRPSRFLTAEASECAGLLAAPSHWSSPVSGSA